MSGYQAYSCCKLDSLYHENICKTLQLQQAEFCFEHFRLRIATETQDGDWWGTLSSNLVQYLSWAQIGVGTRWNFISHDRQNGKIYRINLEILRCSISLASQVLEVETAQTLSDICRTGPRSFFFPSFCNACTPHMTGNMH